MYLIYIYTYKYYFPKSVEKKKKNILISRVYSDFCGGIYFNRNQLKNVDNK